MKINRFTHLVRIIFNIIATVAVLFISMAMFLDFVINDKITIFANLLSLILICCTVPILECFYIVLNKCSKNYILFSNDCVFHKGRKYYVDTISFRYFKFQWTFLETDLVIPKLLISISNEKNIICYISKKQLKILKNKMGYIIKEI